MDAFDDVRNLNMPEVTDSANLCNNTTNANNGYHTNNDMQSDYMPTNTTNIESINYKPEDDTTAGEYQSIENLQENETDTNADDLEYDKKMYNSAEQPIIVEEPEPVKSDGNNEGEENGDEKEDNIVDTEPNEESEEKMSNGMDKESVDNKVESEIKEEDEKKEEEGDSKNDDEDEEKDSLKNAENDKEENAEEDDEDKPLVKQSENKKNTSAKNSPAPKRGPRGPYNKNRSKLDTASSAANKQNEEVEESQCRVCLVKDDLISIFKTDNKLSIADKLMTVCSGIRIQRKDFLPQFICNTCMQSVQVAYNLKVLCETTDKDLRSKLSRSKKKMRRPATEYVLLDATKFPSEESDADEDNDDEFKLSNEEIAKTSGSDATDSGTDYGSKRRSRRVRSKKTQQRRKRVENRVVAPIVVAAKPIVIARTTQNSASKRTRKESSSPEKRVSVDFSSGSEDDYTPPQRKQRKPDNNRTRSGPGPGAVNAPKEAQCPYCNEMFPSQSALMKHKKIHSNQPLNCDMCGKTFKLLAAYQAHIEKHKSDGDSLKCDKCEKTFTKLVERKRHLIEVHNEKPETFPCEKCKRVFALKKSLERHLEDNKCPGPKTSRPIVSAAPQKKIKTEVETLTLGRDLFKCVAPITTTYWSDSFSD